MTWSSVHRRIAAIKDFDAFLRGRMVPGPWLADEPAQVRMLMLDYLGHLRASAHRTGAPRPGQPLSQASVQRHASDVEQFYVFMADNKDAAAVALAEPGWLQLGPQHAGFYRRGELPGKHQPEIGRQVIDDDGALADPDRARTARRTGRPKAGSATSRRCGSPCWWRCWAVASTRSACSTPTRSNRCCPPCGPTTARTALAIGQAPVAKLRYQQTKIDGAPNTILVHAEIVAIIREQQQWAARHFAEHGSPGARPKYLFLAPHMNRNGDRPYSDNSLRPLLNKLAARLDVRDGTGTLINFSRTHRFRHTGRDEPAQ